MRPKLHFTPIKNWMNDPNGFIYFKGYYHLFYQHFPYDVKWGTMHWGHKISKDFIHWEDKGIALYPSKDFDRNGCFSGSAIEVNNKMYLYYTAVVYTKLNPDNIHVSGDSFLASQAMFISEDGIHFDSNTKRVVIPTFDKDDKIGHWHNTRDPKVWKEDDTYYMVIGSQYADGKKMKGQILIYTSNDALNWQYKNRLINPTIDSHMWECPDIFKINDKRILIMSPEDTLKDGINYPSHASWSFIDFNKDTCESHMTSELQYLDYGLDLYAPTSTIDEYGNRVVVAWLRMSEAVDNEWIGMFTLPRVVTIKNNHVCFHVHPHVDKLFKDEVDSFTNIEPLKISVDLKEGSYLNIGGYQITYEDGCVHTNREKVFTDVSKLFNKKSNIGKKFSTPLLKNGNHIDIYVDANVIEIYINNGEYVLTNIVYGMNDDFEYNDIENLKMYKADV
ncbi:MAG: glycoside hydrolase family 32 protein [Bacilli bacterium]|nr:glycoside hydrolase family 32 protein [Bacilli bacterium]